MEQSSNSSEQSTRGSLRGAREEERKAIEQAQKRSENESESFSSHLGPPTRTEFNFLRKRMRKLEQHVHEIHENLMNEEDA